MISTKGRYALRVMIDLAENSAKTVGPENSSGKEQPDQYIALKDVAERQGISKKYLEQIVPLLNKTGLLRTNRGNKGGYMLSGKAEEITVGDVLRATEGSLAPVACLDFEPNECPRAAECSTLFVWEGLYKAVNDYLDSVTLKDIIERGTNISGDYCI